MQGICFRCTDGATEAQRAYMIFWRLHRASVSTLRLMGSDIRARKTNIQILAQLLLVVHQFPSL
jgi:hypothetical protein